MIPGLEGGDPPVLLFVEVFVFGECVADLDPTLDLSLHGFVGWLGLVPSLDHSESFFEFIGILGDVFGQASLLLVEEVDLGGELWIIWFQLSPVWR